MKLKSKISALIIASVAALSVATTAYADRNEQGRSSTSNEHGRSSTSNEHGRSSTSNEHGRSNNNNSIGAINLGATLVGAVGFTGTGSVRYSLGTNGGGLQARIHLPVNGVTILDTNTAVNSAYTLTISNGASTVASCSLVISNVDFTPATATLAATESAEFVASVSEVGTSYIASIGSCGASTTALPVLAAGDTVSISLNGAAPILTGTLATLVGHY